MKLGSLVVAVLLVASSLACAGAAPQRTERVNAKEENDPSSEVVTGSHLKGLLDLGIPSLKDGVTVHYSAGAEGKAPEVAKFVGGAKAFIERWLKVPPEDIHVAFLSPEDWQRAPASRPMPYGMPFVSGTPPVLFIPASGDNTLTNLLLSLEGRVTPKTRKKIESAGLTFKQAAEAFPEQVALHELGHAYFAKGYQLWMNEMLASYIAYATLQHLQPGMAQVLDGLTDAQVEGTTPSHRTLEDFNRLYFKVGVESYVWYQGKFQERNEVAFAQHGLDFIPKVKALFPEPGDVPTALSRLESLSPGYLAWAQEMASAAPAR